MYCNTAACGEFARLLKSSINHSIDPCDSFGSFVCYGWRRQNPYSVREKHYRATLVYISRLTHSEQIPLARQSALQQVAAFYRSCSEHTVSGRDDTQLVKSWLVDAGVVWPVWPTNPSVLDTLAYLALNLGWSSVIDIEVERPGRQSAVITLKRSLSFLLISSHNLSAPDQRRLFKTLRHAFQPKDDTTRSRLVTFADIARIERDMVTELVSASTHRQQLSLGEAQLYRSPSEWNATVARHTRTGAAVSFRSTHPLFFLEFARLWRQHGEREVHLLVSWHAVRFAAYFALARLANSYSSSENEDEFHRDNFCMVLLYATLGDIVFASYSTLVFSGPVRQDVKTLVLSVRETFAQLLSADSKFTTTVSALAGWSFVNHVFAILDHKQGDSELTHAPLPGVPDFGGVFAINWRSAIRALQRAAKPLRRSLFPETLNRASLFEIIPELRDFVLLPSALAFPVYDAAATAAIKYGGLGSHVAQASARIFLATLFGNDTDVSDELRQFLIDLRDCLQQDAALPSPPTALKLMEELFALSSLVEAFFSADKKDNRMLHDLPALSSTQLFFATWCFMRCTGSQSAGDNVDPCSPALRHVKAFSDAFECAKDTGLNPARRCELF
ncbi:endothelin-converting enzyme 1-like [Dermacentor variabilis]|uniref:endothelin-converting enzyme 1-like n=1 Tax=Dermacentor variabilis TaxID=34621 RepID=UPI003F5B4779